MDPLDIFQYRIRSSTNRNDIYFFSGLDSMDGWMDGFFFSTGKPMEGVV